MAYLGIQKLFDRIIDVTLVTADNSDTLVMKCPRTGIKPEMTIKGTFGGNTLSAAELRIKNFYSPIDLSSGDGPSYKWIHIDAGYLNSLESAMDGEIFTAYQSSPPPDGDTVFTFYTGPFGEWALTDFANNYDEGTRIDVILNDICAAVRTKYPKMDVQVKSTLAGAVCKSKIAENTTVANFCFKLARNENLVIIPVGKTLRAFSKNFDDSGSGNVHVLEFISDVKKTAAGYTITAPWVPSIRPFDTVYLDPKYYSSDVGGMYIKLLPNLLVISVDFEFSTIGGTNRMIVNTVAGNYLQVSGNGNSLGGSNAS